MASSTGRESTARTAVVAIPSMKPSIRLWRVAFAADCLSPAPIERATRAVVPMLTPTATANTMPIICSPQVTAFMEPTPKPCTK